MLELAPILKTLWRRPTGPLLIILQLALSIAMVSNALSFISQRHDYISRDTGIEVSGLLIFDIQQDASLGNLEETVISDLAYIKSQNAVQSVAPLTGVPMSNRGGTTGLSTEPDVGEVNSETAIRTSAAMLRAGEDTIQTLGARIVEGRDFNAGEYISFKRGAEPQTGSIIITRALAKTLFPNEANALGKIIYSNGTSGHTVIGIVDDMFGHFIEWDFPRHVIIYPFLEMQGWLSYAVRVDDKSKGLAQEEIKKGLGSINKDRIVSNARTMKNIHREAYAGDHALIKLLGSVLVMLVGVNALGIVGLTSFWVAQRRKQIGIRRALGATRLAIMRYFLIENIVIVLMASSVGAIFAMGASAYMVKVYSFSPLPWLFIPVASLVVLLITLGASIAPVRKASYISPVEAVSGK